MKVMRRHVLMTTYEIQFRGLSLAIVMNATRCEGKHHYVFESALQSIMAVDSETFSVQTTGFSAALRQRLYFLQSYHRDPLEPLPISSTVEVSRSPAYRGFDGGDTATDPPS